MDQTPGPFAGPSSLGVQDAGHAPREDGRPAGGPTTLMRPRTMVRDVPRVAFLLAFGLLVLSPPLAWAGTESSPEMQDASKDTSGSVASDLLAVWLEATPRGVRVHVKTADVAADHVYAILFTVGGRPYLAAIGLDGRGGLDGHVGTARSGEWGPGGWERAANGRLVDLGMTNPGPRPTQLRGTIPWGEVPGLEPGATLTRLSARADFYNRQRDSWFLAVDDASTTRTFVASTGPTVAPLPVEPPAPDAPAWPRLLAATLLGALLGLLALLQTRRLPQRTTPPSAEPQAPPSPTGADDGTTRPRLRLDPRA